MIGALVACTRPLGGRTNFLLSPPKAGKTKPDLRTHSDSERQEQDVRYREKKVDANLSRRSSAEEKSLSSSGAMDLMLKTLSKIHDKSRFPSEETVARFTEEELTEAAVQALDGNDTHRVREYKRVVDGGIMPPPLMTSVEEALCVAKGSLAPRQNELVLIVTRLIIQLTSLKLEQPKATFLDLAV